MPKKMFVGCLPWSVSDRELSEAFALYGVVTDAEVVRDKDTGRSRGFGFVTLEDGDAVDKAIIEMNGSQFRGRTLWVYEANEVGNNGQPGPIGFIHHSNFRGGWDDRRSHHAANGSW